MPELSVVIPTYRRHDALARVLERLERQDVPPHLLEVIVVSDDRDDDPERVDRAIGSRSFPVRRLARPSPGVSAARNRGWQAARAELVLFLGDDILPDRRFVSEHLGWHRQTPEPAVGVLGRIDWARELRVTPFMRWLDRGIQFGYGSIRGEEADWWHLYTSNVSLKRTMLERVGGFDEAFPFGYEDIDLAKRMFALGFRLRYNPAARAEHLHRPSIEEWRGRMAKVAPAERRFVAKHPELEPYFLRLFGPAAEGPAPGAARRALLALAPHVAAVVPPATPLIGERVARVAGASYRRVLAPAFLAAWRADVEAERAPARS